jgi:hypothetical protein
VDKNHSLALDHQLTSRRQVGKLSVVVTAHCVNGRDGGQGLEGRARVHVASVEDQVAAREGGEHSVGKAVDELRAVSVGDDADPCGQLGRSLSEFKSNLFNANLDKMAKQTF